ncbi:CYTH domain-containing protein [Halomonas sp. TRM85114]|uniref:CYTH domain-containing protein n=1 Tax=Halomonas jincaotanensis TaxID=2810616 RepID=UPI001BD4EAD1|nr:CYTH domain-containing protein [Halomonas jincaotanensis]MBS9403213.1 CYTH domain-containing protein [Halomonas jincaotanensis]
MNQEIELKLALAESGPAQLRDHPRLAGITPSVATLGNTYFDTPGAELEAARMALRLRRDGDRLRQTLKTRGQGGGGLSTRGEWEWEVAGPGLDLNGLAALPPLADFSEAQLARLAPRFATDFRRETWQLEDAESHIELALDLGEIHAGERRVAIREMELEIKRGEPGRLWALAEALTDRVGLRPADTSKAARGNALLTGEWRLPEGGQQASAWLHRAVVALDAYTDTHELTWREAARHAFQQLAELDGGRYRREIAPLIADLHAPDWPTPAFGRAALQLTRRLPADVTL